MSIIFMNSNSSKTPDPHRLVLNHIYKMDLQRGDKRSTTHGRI